MIELYSNNIDVSANASIPLNNTIVLKGYSTISQGTASIQINKCGIYKVDVTATANAATAGSITIQLRKNNTLQPQTLSSVTSSGTATDLYTLGFTTLVQVSENNNINNPCTIPTEIEIVNAGIAATFNNIDIVVTRI